MSEIYTKIAAINKEIKAVSKAQKNLQQGFMFRGIDVVMNELHDVFAKHEVFVLPEVLDYTVTNRPTKSGGVQFSVMARIKFTFTTTDGSSVSVTNVGEAMDSGDKAMNKAMSIALKYALLQVFLIPTEDKKDPDEDTPEETDFNRMEDDNLSMAIQEIEGAQSKETLVGIYNNYKMLQNNPKFKEALSAKKKEL